MQGGEQLIENATEALDRVNRVLSDRNIANLSGTMADLKAVSGSLAANRSMFQNASSAMARLDSTMADAKATIGDVRGLVNGDGRRALANAADAAEELKATVVQARGVLANIAKQTDTIGDGTLPQITETMRSLQDTSDNLDALLRGIRQDPGGTLFKGRAKEREVQP